MDRRAVGTGDRAHPGLSQTKEGGPFVGLSSKDNKITPLSLHEPCTGSWQLNGEITSLRRMGLETISGGGGGSAAELCCSSGHSYRKTRPSFLLFNLKNVKISSDECCSSTLLGYEHFERTEIDIQTVVLVERSNHLRGAAGCRARAKHSLLSSFSSWLRHQ